MAARLKDYPPRVLMSLTRPKLHLDEQSFQGLLAAAFTIQEHADLLKQVVEVKAKTSPGPEAVPAKVCRHCAAPLTESESRCSHCGMEEFRPGERMQRKFASLWEMSKEHGIRQEPVPGHGEESILELASSGLVATPESARQLSDPNATPGSQQDEEWSTGPPIEMDHPIESRAVPEDEAPDPANQGAASPNVLQNLWQQLSLHRADLYLGVAVLVAVLALLWPTPAPPQKPRLDAWQRVLVQLGIAEAPAPQIHYRGDPNLEVWVDPHTALYYCPGDEQFGKTADGRRSTQRDAQIDQFEPANRAACN